MKPRIALVQGDAAGIGAELMSKLLSIDEVRARAHILVISDPRVLRAGCAVSGLDVPVREIADVAETDWSDEAVNLLASQALDPQEVPLGRMSVAAGAAVSRGSRPLRQSGRRTDTRVSEPSRRNAA